MVVNTGDGNTGDGNTGDATSISIKSKNGTWTTNGRNLFLE